MLPQHLFERNLSFREKKRHLSAAAVVMAAVEGGRQTGLKKEERLLYRFRTHAKAALLDQLTTN